MSANLYKKRFCIFDDHAICGIDLPESDPELKKILSYSPLHHIHLFEEKGLKIDREFIYSTEREIIETDRAGWRFYDRVYSKHLGHLCLKEIELLEIGIEYGYGLLAWSRYFQNAQVYGMELVNKFQNEYDVIRQKFPEQSSRIRFNVQFNSSLVDDWKTLYKDKKFDVIIDDGAHSSEIQMKTLLNGVDYLKEKAFYFIEDIKLDNASPAKAIEYFNFFTEISKKHNFNMTIYKHINLYRVKLLEMSKSERIFSGIDRITRERPHVDFKEAAEFVKRSMEVDNGNYFNYMIAFYRI
jgi:hypothetical protein